MDQQQIGAQIDHSIDHWTILQQTDSVASVTLRGHWDLPPDMTATMQQVYVRVVREEDGTEAVPWTGASMMDDQQWFHMLAIPAGGLYRIETSFQHDESLPIEWCVRGDMIHHIGVGDVWVIAGQSNASGFGRGPFFDPPELGIHLLRHNGRWDLATHPFSESTATIHPANRDLPNPGHGPYLAFARLLKRACHYPIGLVQTALGGSPLSSWNPDQDGYLYRNMMEIIQLAGGNIKGILWYQGESDANPREAHTYLDRFKRLVEHWRRDLDNPSLPILTVQLNRYTGELSDLQDDRAWGTLREHQRRAAQEIADLYVIPALDVPLTDDIHTGPAGNVIVGERLAKVALGELYGRQRPQRAPNVVSAIWDQMTEAEQPTILLRFENVQGYLLAVGPKDGTFQVEDAQGRNPVLYWIASDNDTLRLIVAREAKGDTFVHGAAERNPAAALPIDTATYLPALAFYGLVVEH